MQSFVSPPVKLNSLVSLDRNNAASTPVEADLPNGHVPESHDADSAIPEGFHAELGNANNLCWRVQLKYHVCKHGIKSESHNS